MNSLSADLVPFLGRASILIAKQVGWKVCEETPNGSQRGTVTFEALEVIAGEEPRVGESISVAFERRSDPEMRFRTAANHWNTLALQEGDLLLLACRHDGDWTALAAHQVLSTTAAEVEQVRRCSAIEKARSPIEALQETLGGGRSILRDYAVQALTERGGASREVAAEMLGRAIESASAAPRDRAELADRLIAGRLFAPARGADPTNRRVFGILARGLGRDAGSEFRERWIDLLEYCLRSEGIRGALIRSVPADVSARVVEVLHEAAADSSKDDPGTAEALFNLWTLEE